MLTLPRYDRGLWATHFLYLCFRPFMFSDCWEDLVHSFHSPITRNVRMSLALFMFRFVRSLLNSGRRPQTGRRRGDVSSESRRAKSPAGPGLLKTHNLWVGRSFFWASVGINSENRMLFNQVTFSVKMTWPQFALWPLSLTSEFSCRSRVMLVNKFPLIGENVNYSEGC